MRLLHKTENLAPPNVCILCNTQKSPTETRVIDTGFTMVAPKSWEAIWRKYVCEVCGTEIANALGFVSNEQAKAAFHAANVATERLDSVRQKVTAAADEIAQFARDVTLGNERSAVGNYLKGEYAQPAQIGQALAPETEPQTKKPVGRPRKAPESGNPVAVNSGSADK